MAKAWEIWYAIAKARDAKGDKVGAAQARWSGRQGRISVGIGRRIGPVPNQVEKQNAQAQEEE